MFAWEPKVTLEVASGCRIGARDRLTVAEVLGHNWWGRSPTDGGWVVSAAAAAAAGGGGAGVGWLSTDQILTIRARAIPEDDPAWWVMIEDALLGDMFIPVLTWRCVCCRWVTIEDALLEDEVLAVATGPLEVNGLMGPEFDPQSWGPQAWFETALAVEALSQPLRDCLARLSTVVHDDSSSRTDTSVAEPSGEPEPESSGRVPTL